ncbi:MAG: hypothetical protein K0S46_1823 [Moraxellaceae bacterium]|jgi:hypothetical protein|nr:hypothetical protein [Moraxellaceae bacterium]
MNRPDRDLDDPELSQLYKSLPDEQPASATDDLIRAASRRAIGAGPGRRPSPLALSRITATAAALVLGVALTVQWQARTPEQFQEAVGTVPMSRPAPVATEIPATDAKAAPGEHAAPQQKLARRESAPVESARRLENDADAGADAGAKPKASNSTASDELGALSLHDEPPAATAAPASPVVAHAPAAGVSDASPPPTASLQAPELEAAQPLQRTAKLRAFKEEARAANRVQALPGSQARQALDTADTRPAPDYRSLIAEGRLDEALAALPQDGALATTLDRDLIKLAQGRRTAPGCATHPAAPTAAERALCELVVLRAAGRPLPANWPSRPEVAGAITGTGAYRAQLVQPLLSPP